ncbi:Retrovirus-related Pol polyprotein from transposon TNT 1-94 [Dendrobium catenatum]|uniref:Retrovirus-related Pol polyprotein from transposon TNT 1-94 n=1 Tax=Dendrobium catenatum TaxID=906689 RepID=A0A2I0VHB8_9ASPA|nr:Retrovirus-related Pol polyprotein from transposon TNT 1-94 [Dendrobium catenatum]
MKDSQDHRLLLRGRLNKGLYQISAAPSRHHAALHTTASTSHLWHARLGHPNNRILATLAHNIPISNFTQKNFSCNSCHVAKSHKLSFNKRISDSKFPFDIQHTDVWGPAPTNSTTGFRYYVVFIDDYTRYTWIYFMHSKHETFSKFKLLCSFIKTQFGKVPKQLQSDSGGEYLSMAFLNYLQEQGIQQRLTCPHTPEQNGVAERKHRHVLELTRTLFHSSNVPTQFWPEVVATAAYLINRLPSASMDFQSPYQRLHQKEPNYDHLRVFGCLCHPWSQPYSADKFSPRSHDSVFLGYSPTHKGYKCYNPLTGKTIISRHVVFQETIFPYNKIKHSEQIDSPIQESQLNPLLLVPTSTLAPQTKHVHLPQQPQSHAAPLNHPVSSIQNITASTNAMNTIAPEARTTCSTHHMQTRSKSGIIKPNPHYSLLSQPTTQATPTSYKQACTQQHWQKAMEAEFNALQHQQTWVLVPAPANKHILGCKWTFKTKTLPNGQIERYKARLVALGYEQRYGEIYKETFSPVAKMPTIRILLALAITRKWPLLQLDVSNAFLHGDLPDDIYMRQPQGFVDPNNPNAVCKLRKSLYGLKQAPRQWFQKLTDFLREKGFRFSQSDPSLLLFTQTHIRIYLLIYVDDILITGNDPTAIQDLLRVLQSNFALKQLGEVSLFLGIKIQKNDNGYLLSQTHYARKILQEAGFAECKAAPTPITPNPKQISQNNTPFSNPSLYRRIAGSLQYLSLTRPDIAYATNRACQHMSNPTNQDYKNLTRLLRYIKGALTLGLPITPGGLQLSTYTDADWASDSTDRKSISGHCTFLGPNLISWSVKKQVTVAKSSTEAEYRALSAASSDVLWLRRLTAELQLDQPAPTPIYCDNISAIAIAKNPVYHARTKHIEIDYQFIRQHIALQNIVIHHIPSTEQIADIFTKAFSSTRFNTLRSKLTIRNTTD